MQQTLDDTLAPLLARLGDKEVLGIFAPLSQLHMEFHAALRRAGMPVIAFPPEKIDAALALIGLLNIGMVVGRKTELEALLASRPIPKELEVHYV